MAGKRKNGTGTVRKRSNGSWEARFIVSYSLEGKPTFKSVSAATKSECIKRMQEAKEKLGVTHEKVSPDMLFGNWIDCWYQFYCKPRIRESTQLHYENMIYKHIIPGIGNIQLDKLTQKDLQTFYNKEKTDGRQAHVEILGAGLSNAMVRSIHALCRSSLEKARIDKLMLSLFACMKLKRNLCDAKKKRPLKSCDFRGLWSEWWGSNPRASRSQTARSIN